MENKNSINVGLSVYSIGFITWIVFMIMDYGCNMEWITSANNAINYGGHFWTWFPLWAPLALDVAVAILLIPIIIICAHYES